MQPTFYFYDLETSGVNPREARIMQFAGQRTNMQLEPIGEPDNILVKLSADILPEPDAVLITGITPQKVNAEGITEAEFLRYFNDKIATPATIMTGFNSIRFDDEFMRFTLYRNFYDPYEWQWQDGRSKWDLLDVVRMTRALRPDGIEWPFAPDGAPTNRLEMLTALNGLDHQAAHDALSDVTATIAISRLIQNKQPRLFDYLLNMRDKRKVSALVEKGEPFVYASGRYASEFQKTTVACLLTDAPNKQGVLVYDLRFDPKDFIDLDVQALTEKLKYKKDRDDQPLPVKVLQYNRCPAVAPMNVLDDASKKRIGIQNEEIQTHFARLQSAKDFADKVRAAYEAANKREQTGLVVDETTVDAQLYDGFFSDFDKTNMRAVRAADANELADLHLDFNDQRLGTLLQLYKARNYPTSLTSDEQKTWQDFCKQRLMSGGESSRAAKFFKRLQDIGLRPGLTANEQYLLEELQLYAQSILPIDD